jgi:DNA-binding MarR family transcriptional regulator
MNSFTHDIVHEGLEIILANVIQEFILIMKHHGLSMPQIHALMYIYHSGVCQVSDIGGLAGVSNAAASQLVERLVAQDLVERNEDPANRRTKILKLSEKGKELIQESVSSNHFLIDIMATLTPAQYETVRQAFTILAHTASDVQHSQIGKVTNNA